MIIGGILVIFIYITRLASNEIFSPSNKIHRVVGRVTKSRVITGLVTGHNTLQKHLHLVGLIKSPLCRRSEAEEETSAHILRECEALASLRHAYLGSIFFDPEVIKV